MTHAKRIIIPAMILLTAATLYANRSFRSALAYLETTPGTNRHAAAIASWLYNSAANRRESPRVKEFFAYLDAALRNFDFARLHQSSYLRSLPGGYRGVTLAGINRPGAYRVNFSTRNYQLTPVAAFGDGAAEAGLKEVPDSSGDDRSFQFYAKARANMAHVDHTRALAFVQGLQQILDPENIQSIDRPHCNRFGNLNRPSRLLMNDFCHHFPHMSSFLNRYGYLESLVEVLEYEGKSYTHVNFTGRPRLDAIQEDYPHIYEYLDDLDDVGYISIAFKNDKGETISRFIMDSETLTIRWEAWSRNGKVLPVDAAGRPVFEREFDIRKFSEVYGYTDIDTRLRIYGLQIDATNIIAQGGVTRTKDGAFLEGNLNRVPKINFSGRFGHVLPTWLIDLGIPGNMQDLGERFFKTLAQGNGGRGTNLGLQWRRAGADNHLRLYADTEILDNRFVNFSMRIWMNRIRLGNEAAAELDQITGRVFSAAVADIRELKSK